MPGLKEDTNREPQAVPLAGGLLGPPGHVCALFDTRDEEYRVLLPFVKQGLEAGEKAIHIVDPALRDDHVARLGAVGIDVAAAQARRQLEVLDWKETYLRGGSFDRRETSALVEGILGAARADGFARARIVAHMEWALPDRYHTPLVEYESGMHDVLRRYGDPVICTYDRARFGAGTAMDVLRAHPIALLDGALQENPSFRRPARFLPTLQGPIVSRLRDRYVTALVAGASREALDIVVEEALWQDVPAPSLYLDVIQAAQYEIGRLCEEKRITVTHERLATEISRLALAHLHPHLPSEPSNGKRVVVSCVEGELHELGARMVADFLEMAGFEVRFLGANVPSESLAELVRQRPPHLLALSATVSAHVAALRRAIAVVRSVADGRVPIAAGGRVFLQQPGLARELDADIHARDARGMVAAARRLFGVRSGRG